MRTTITHIIMLLMVGIFFSACGTYYDKTSSVEKSMVSKNYSKAEEEVRKNKFLNKRRNALLYYLELGKLENLQGKFEESNRHLNYADDMMDQYRNVLEMAVGVTINPAVQAYKSEAHERILVHYYKALNYLQLGKTEDAIVEARRIDLSTEQIGLDVKGKSSKYGADPFGLMLMGMIYEVDNDYNNAFIAYRNAKEIYDNDETGLYSNGYPESLERDLVRTAAYAGLSYKSDLKKVDLPHGEAIIFWESGLAPVKEEVNLFFTLNQKNGSFYFLSGDINIPIDYDFSKNDPEFSPSDIGMLRVAWSRYVERPILNKTAKIIHNGKTHNFYPIENVSALAFQIQKDNYFKELGKNLLRLALKKIAELSLTERNEYAGLALNILNVASEKADTRNWQSLPSQINYRRIPLEEGMNEIKITLGNGETVNYRIEGNGNMVFRNVVSY